MYACKILADSISPEGHRLTTFESTFPRFILPEVNTHRMLSRNSASSRAIPVAKSIKAVRDDPFIPASFPANQPGMQGGADLDDMRAQNAWKLGIAHAIRVAEELERLGVHKAWANRVLEPYKWHTAIISATDWSNFFALRTREDAQPEFRTIALMMQDAYWASQPASLSYSDWHLPFINDDERKTLSPDECKLVSIGRCARVSYLTHDGKRDPKADIDLAYRLIKNFHLSPLEHVAVPFSPDDWQVIDQLSSVYPKFKHSLRYQGNFCGWTQWRYLIACQDDYGKMIDYKVLDAVH